MSHVNHAVRERERVASFNNFMPERTDTLLPLMAVYLKSRWLSVSRARLNGWYPSYCAGDRQPRVVIPATTTPPNIFWQARSLNEALPRYQSPIGNRGNAIVLVWPKVDPVKRVVIVEGPLDALAAAECGDLGLALMGSQPTEEQLLHAARFTRSRQVLLMPDNDQPTVLLALLPFFVNRSAGCKIILPSPYKDLAEMPPDERERLLA